MVTFEVTITGRDMYDYNVYHNYRNFQGIISLLLGIMLLVLCVISFKADANVTYLLVTGFFGLYFTIITPVRIYFKSYQIVKRKPSFQKPFRYTITETELMVEHDGESAKIPMEEIPKVVDTGKSIILYFSSIRANIIPKRDLGDKLPEVVEIIKKSRIRRIKL